jgi:hypothetical protein
MDVERARIIIVAMRFLCELLILKDQVSTLLFLLFATFKGIFEMSFMLNYISFGFSTPPGYPIVK